MKIKINQLPKSKVEITVNLNKKDILPYKETALKELNKNLKINGYRVGKAPITLAENYIPAFKLYEKAAILAVEKYYPKIIKEKKIQAIGYPNINITKIVPEQEVEFKAEVAVMPVLNLPDYKNIAKEMQKEKNEIKVEEKEIKEALIWLQNSHAVLKRVTREAKQGDIVTIDYQIKENGSLIQNGADKNYSFILGKGNFIPGFEKKLIGMKEKETQTFKIRVPKSWPQKDLQNKELVVEVFLKEVKEKELPVLDDNFARKLGKFNNLAELKNNIQQGLLREKENKEKERWRLLVLDKIISKVTVDIPEILIQTEIEKMMEELKMQLEKIQLSFEKYLEQIKKTEEELKSDFNELAEKRILFSLILREIGILENIEISEEQIEKKIEEILRQIPEEEMKENINKENLREFASGILRNEKVFQILENQK